MTALTLKTYQKQALDSLARFLAAGRSTGSLAVAWAQEMQRQAEGQADAHALALAHAQAPYRASAFGNTPCVCLRIPTGGGETLLASHAIALMARTWRLADFSVVLWLVPSTTIRDQTLLALQQPGHAYRAALEAACGTALRVLDLDTAPTLAPQDLGRKAVVLVATMQSFRVRSTQGRNVYAFSEDFDAHFAHFKSTGADLSALEKVEEGDLPTEGPPGCLTRADLGRVKHSLANLLALTDTTFETLKRVAPSAILELTATPVPKKTHVLYSVSARELQAEDMVKLPVMLAEHKDWTDAVPPAVLRQHLLDEKYATDAEIVIATGDQRGLDGLNLFDRASSVRHVITVEALKEGWDCSFAYVLCSLQNVRSGKDVEQLLGRVLRMPYATRRKSPALNRAYAHVVARSFSEAASALVDRMVQGMGFEALNAAAVVLPDPGVPGLFDDGTMAPQSPPVPVLTLSPAAAAALQGEPDVRVAAPRASGDSPTLQVAGEVSDALLGRLLAALPPAEHAAVSAQVQPHNHRIHAARAPAQRGVPFAPVPRLCVGLQVGAPGRPGSAGAPPRLRATDLVAGSRQAGGRQLVGGHVARLAVSLPARPVPGAARVRRALALCQTLLRRHPCAEVAGRRVRIRPGPGHLACGEALGAQHRTPAAVLFLAAHRHRLFLPRLRGRASRRPAAGGRVQRRCLCHQRRFTRKARHRQRLGPRQWRAGLFLMAEKMLNGLDMGSQLRAALAPTPSNPSSP